jgi:Ca2+-binding EF-hand superfamily protein
VIFLLEYINDKIKEKFPKMAQAYRFFDAGHKSAINLQEFTTGLKNLKIVITDEETEKVFKFLDKNNDDLLTYNEF